MQDQRTFGTFEQVVLPHLDAAYNLARWLTRRDHDAEDVVQEACLRAFNAYPRFHGGDARCWLLTIVRNTCFTWLGKNRESSTASFDESLHDVGTKAMDPHLVLQANLDRELVHGAIESLPVEYREVIVLRELEGLSYQQIASVADLPMGTVMSRLARARSRLAQALGAPTTKEVGRDV